MRVGTTAFVLAISLALLIPSLGGAEAQDGDCLSLTTELMLTSLDSVEGSGNVEFRFDGSPAAALRAGIVATYDSNKNQYIDSWEAKEFLSDLGEEMTGRQYWGVSILRPTNYSAMSDGEVASKTSGLANTVPSSTFTATFSYDFEAGGDSTTRMVRLSELALQTFVDSLHAVVGFSLDGSLRLNDRVMLFGLSAYTKPDLVFGKVSELRTPIGSVLWYSFEGEVSDTTLPPSETLTFERFNVFENQQMAFIVLVIGCTLILRLPARRFEKYRLQHPKKYRKSARPLRGVRGFSWSLVVLLSLLYLLPFMFSFADPNLLIYSWHLYFVAPVAVVASYVFSRAMYGVASLRIPEEIVIEVKQAVVESDDETGELRCQVCMRPFDVGLDMYECVCGFIMHMACAERAQACPHCGVVLFPEHTRSVECRVCGEPFLTSGEEDAFTLQCTKCGAFQEEVAAGRNYLVVDMDGTRAFNMLRSMGLSGRPAMVMTSDFPGKVREKYELGDDFDVKWLTEGTEDIDSVNIKDLEGDAMETVSTFLMTTKRSGLLLDGLETIIAENGFDSALAFVKRLNDLAAIHGASVILWLDRNRLPDDQNDAVSDEFDEIHDYL